MRRTGSIVAALALAISAGTLGSSPAAEELLIVDDGDFFYDQDPADGICEGTTNDHTKGEATRHWHAGIPFVPSEAEAAGGYGCLGGPTFWEITIDPGKVGTISGSVTYTWDQDVPGGGLNDVHLHVFDADRNVVASTLQDDGPNPVIPNVGELILSHPIDMRLDPGAYVIEEDVFSGEHTAWLTTLVVRQKAASGSDEY